MVKNVKITKNKKEKTKFCTMKIDFYKEMITNTIISVQRYKSMDIIIIKTIKPNAKGYLK